MGAILSGPVSTGSLCDSVTAGCARTVTLDEADRALNDEIAALVRVGVPLELGLRQLGGDLPARMGRLAKDLAQRMMRGKPY